MYFAAALENCSRRCCPWRGLDMVLSTTYQLQTIPPYWSWNDGHFWTRHLSKKELFAHLEPYSSIGHLQVGKILNIEPGWTLHIEMILNCIFSWGECGMICHALATHQQSMSDKHTCDPDRGCQLIHWHRWAKAASRLSDLLATSLQFGKCWLDLFVFFLILKRNSGILTFNMVKLWTNSVLLYYILEVKS